MRIKFLLLLCFLLPWYGQVQSQVQLPQYWKSVERKLTQTMYGQEVAVNVNNCYYANYENPAPITALDRTLDSIHQAIESGADLLELDIIEVDEVIRIAQRDSRKNYGAELKKVLQDELLRQSDQLLFLEIKEEKLTSERFMWMLLNDLKNYGYAHKGRPVTLRAFEDEQARMEHLITAKQLLDGYFSPMKEGVKFSVLINPTHEKDVRDFQERIRKVSDAGYDMVEFNYNMENLVTHIAYARKLGLGVGLWKIPDSVAHIVLPALRNEVDVFSITFNAKLAKGLIQTPNSLFYLNAYRKEWQSANNLSYYLDTAVVSNLSLNQANVPALTNVALQKAQPIKALFFQSGQNQFLQTQPFSNTPKKGYFVATAVQFDQIKLREGQRSVLLQKSENSDFVLELFNPGGDMPTVLRFGVKVNKIFHYAFLSTEDLDLNTQYLVVGAYDSDGTIELWINQDRTGVQTGHTLGAVVTEQSPVIIGNGVKDKTVGFSGKIQFVAVNWWGRR